VVALALLSAAACPRPRLSAIHDQLGNPISPHAVERLLPLAPDVVEFVYAVGAGGRVVAVPRAADEPPQVRDLPKVRVDDPESIVALAPDLVLATTAGNDPRIIARLRELGVAVCVFDVTSCASLVEACRLAGKVVGREAAGAELAADVSARCRAAARRAARLPLRKALYIVWWEPLIVAAPGSFHDDLLRLARLDNLAPSHAGRYPRVSPETLLDPRLEVIVAPDEPAVREGFAHVLAGPAGSRLADGRLPVIWLPADIANRPGPRLPRALELLVDARRGQQ
jgi:iron complex transport system substrate-binding protein